MIEGCDTLLMVGTSFPYSEFLPKEGQARCVEIEIDPSRIGIRYPVDVQLVGDAKETLRALLPKLERKEDRSWREEIEAQRRGVVGASSTTARRGRRPDEPAARRLGALAAPARGAIVTRRLRLLDELVGARPQAAHAARCASLSGTLATMGPGALRDRGQVRAPRAGR